MVKVTFRAVRGKQVTENRSFSSLKHTRVHTFTTTIFKVCTQRSVLTPPQRFHLFSARGGIKVVTRMIMFLLSHESKQLVLKLRQNAVSRAAGHFRLMH